MNVALKKILRKKFGGMIAAIFFQNTLNKNLKNQTRKTAVMGKKLGLSQSKAGGGVHNCYLLQNYWSGNKAR